MATEFRGYTILDTLGRGGMASLYLGVQEDLERQVVIKLLDKRLARNSTFVLRFEREAGAASELNHRNIVTIHEYGQENGEYFIVMEHVKGRDLRAVLTQVPALPPEIVLILLEEIASGLSAAHERGIVHRDVRPGNVLLSDAGDVKVTDFGLARDHRVDASRLFDSLTQGGTVLGPPSYLSPEQAEGMALDHKTDTFSLGIMAYEMFSGQKPFSGETCSLIREAIVDREPPPITRNRQLAGPEIEAMVRRMLAKDPLRRPSMHDLLPEIERCMETLDPGGTLLKYRRRFLKQFAADPAAFSDRLESLAAQGSPDHTHYVQALGLDRPDTSRETAGEPSPAESSQPLAAASPEPALPDAEPGPAPRAAPADPDLGWERPPAIPRRAIAFATTALVVAALVFVAVRQGLLNPFLGESESPRTDVDFDREVASGLVAAEAAHTLPPDTTFAVRPEVVPVLGRTFLRTWPVGCAVALRPSGVTSWEALPDSTPLLTAELRLGRYDVRFTKDGYQPLETGFVVRDGRPDTVSVVLNDAAPPLPVHDETPEPRAANAPEVATPQEGWMRLRTDPPGDFYVDGVLVAQNVRVAVVNVSTDRNTRLEVRHPGLFVSRVWANRPAPGDTLDLGEYRVATGTLRVTTRPFAPVEVQIGGRDTRRHTPLALTVASRRQLVSMRPPGWIVEKIVVTDGSAGAEPIEVVPDGDDGLAAVFVDVRDGHDHNVVFHLVPEGG